MVFVAHVAETEFWTHMAEAGDLWTNNALAGSWGKWGSSNQSKAIKEIQEDQGRTQNPGKQRGTDLKTQGKEDQRETGDSNQGGADKLCGGKKNPQEV